MAPSYRITPEKRAGKGQFFYRQLFVTPPPVLASQVNLTGKTSIITGANGGLGLETARQLLSLGSKVILAVRNESKGKAARQDLIKAGFSESNISVWSLDLSSYPSILAFANRASLLEKLHIAVLNAGLFKLAETFSPEGYEESVQVNYLSNMLLALLLLPVLSKTSEGSKEPGRMVIVSSDIAAWSRFSERQSRPILSAFKAPMSKWNGIDRYGTSKLLGQLFVSELAKCIPSSAVTVSVANCGLCRGSELGRQFKGVMNWVLSFAHWCIGRDPEVGARSFVHAVTTLGERCHGEYVEDGKVQPMAPIVYKDEGAKLARTLFEETLEELSFADVRKNLKG